MISKEVKVVNEAGLHTRPASIVVRTAAKYKSTFFIEKDEYEINGKSIIGVMTLAAEQGCTLKLVFEGDDEKEALAAMIAVFENGFGEQI